MLALAIGVIYGTGLLFGPFFIGCTVTAVAPGQTPTPAVCRGSSLIEVQGDHLFPAPLLWIVMWSLAPALAVVGVWMRERGHAGAIPLIVLALLLEQTSIISIGGGFVFALTAGLLLLITLIAALGARRQVA